MRHEFAGGYVREHLPRDLDTPRLVPARRKFRRQRADLTADEPNATAMKFTSQVNRYAFVAVPRADDDASLKAGHVDGAI